MMIEKYGTVEMKEWRKDHWSMLAYIACRCVDYKGVLKYTHIRCNEAIHPEMPPEKRTHTHHFYILTDWSDAHSTRIKGGEQIRGHDDWDCSIDLQTAGLIKIVSMDNFHVEMTELGWEASKLLQKHKAAGGVFSSFRYNLKADSGGIT